MLSFWNQISMKIYLMLVHLALEFWDKGTVKIGNRLFEFILRGRCSVANYFKINFKIYFQYFKKLDLKAKKFTFKVMLSFYEFNNEVLAKLSVFVKSKLTCQELFLCFTSSLCDPRLTLTKYSRIPTNFSKDSKTFTTNCILNNLFLSSNYIHILIVWYAAI